MSDLPDMDELKERHHSLYKEIVDKKSVDNKLEHNIEQLLADIKVVARLTTEVDGFLWLMDTAMQWQNVYSTIIKKT